MYFSKWTIKQKFLSSCHLDIHTVATGPRETISLINSLYSNVTYLFLIEWITQCVIKQQFSGEKITELVPAGCFGLLLVEGFSSFFFVCTAIIVSKFSRNEGKRKTKLQLFFIRYDTETILCSLLHQFEWWVELCKNSQNSLLFSDELM